MEKKAYIEAILFSFGDSVPAKKIAEALEISEKEVKELVKEMIVEYETNNHGIRLIELDGSYQFCTKPETYETLIKIKTIPKKFVLTDVVLETLSIIAYKQPITKIEIEKIRGVSCDHAVNKLIEYSLIEEVARLDAPGRPMLFGTTEEFLRNFGVPSIEELPSINQEQIEEFKLQAENEMKEHPEEEEETVII
jgi:segregation and condensation protein B